MDLGHGDLFAASMESLLDVAADGSPECRIHSLNILRTLYRESRLSQVIGPYVARGLMLAISGFEALDWPVSLIYCFIYFLILTEVF